MQNVFALGLVNSKDGSKLIWKSMESLIYFGPKFAPPSPDSIISGQKIDRENWKHA